MSTRRGQLVELARVITASPALLTREQPIFARLTDSLAQLIAEDTGEASGAVERWVAANAHMGVHRGLLLQPRLPLGQKQDSSLPGASSDVEWRSSCGMARTWSSARWRLAGRRAGWR